MSDVFMTCTAATAWSKEEVKRLKMVLKEKGERERDRDLTRLMISQALRTSSMSMLWARESPFPDFSMLSAFVSYVLAAVIYCETR